MLARLDVVQDVEIRGDVAERLRARNTVILRRCDAEQTNFQGVCTDFQERTLQGLDRVKSLARILCDNEEINEEPACDAPQSTYINGQSRDNITRLHYSLYGPTHNAAMQIKRPKVFTKSTLWRFCTVPDAPLDNQTF